MLRLTTIAANALNELKRFDEALASYDRASHAALVLDGAGYHIAAALTIPENVTLVRLPPYAPELNPIENVWEYLRGNKLAIPVFDDYNDIVDKTCDA
jgi:transposase